MRATILCSLLAGVAACGGESSQTPTSAIPPPTPTPSPAVVIASFELAPAAGTVRAAALQWRLEVRLNERVPGLFVRVDLETGIYGQGEACYASEFSQATALDPQARLGVSVTGFARSPRPGSRCDGSQFKPVYAYVRVFAAADPSARQPVASGDFAVSVTVVD